MNTRIKKFAKYIGSSTKLAKKLGMTPQSLSSYTNEGSKPGADILIKLYFLGCNINWLLTGEGDMLIKSNTASPQSDFYEVNKFFKLKLIENISKSELEKIINNREHLENECINDIHKYFDSLELSCKYNLISELNAN